MDKTVFLTGANGFLGRHTLDALKKSGWDVICCVRSAASAGFEHTTVMCDLNNPEEIISLKDLYRADAIVHLACHVDLNESTDERLFVPNVLATGCIAYLAQAWKARLLFSSSVIAHGTHAERIEKACPIEPDTVYGRSKVLGEELIVASGVEHTILRIAGIFGCDGPKHLGLNRAIDDAFNGTRPTQIGSGKALRNYIYVRDVAEAIVSALECNISGVHLLSGSEILPVSQMLETLCEIVLPGTTPLIKEGTEATNQVVQPSPELPRTRTFREALLDIRSMKESCA
jgi:nucleoside-diphosphate-sugar epimerase